MPYLISALLPASLPAFDLALLTPHTSLTQRGVSLPPAILTQKGGGMVLLQITPAYPIRIEKGEALAKLLILPPGEPPELNEEQVGLFAISKTMQQARPTMDFVITDRPFSGILDTGADVSVICTAEWPPEWPTESSPEVWAAPSLQK